MDPKVGRWTYRFFCATSHFGCGHVEVAFFERSHRVTFYAVRNIVSANAGRLGLQGLSTRFRLSSSGEDAAVLHLVSRLLEARGFRVGHAAAEQCIDFSADDRLVSRESVAAVRHALLRKDARLRARFDCGSP